MTTPNDRKSRLNGCPGFMIPLEPRIMTNLFNGGRRAVPPTVHLQGEIALMDGGGARDEGTIRRSSKSLNYTPQPRS